MTRPATLNAIAADVVGHYGHAAKSLVDAYRTASRRALDASGKRYAKLVERAPLPLVGDEGKARIVAVEQRISGIVGQGVTRSAEGYDRAIELVSGQALKGLEAFAQRTDWAKEMFVVDTARRVGLPAAKLSLEIASRIDNAASALGARVQGTIKPVGKRAARKPAAKRVRRAS